jgi:hypothetical protein
MSSRLFIGSILSGDSHFVTFPHEAEVNGLRILTQLPRSQEGTDTKNFREINLNISRRSTSM